MAELNEILQQRLTKTFGGETQEVTANRLNTTQGNVSKWKSGQQIPTTDMLYTISKSYKVSVDWLLGISEDPEIDGLVLEKLTYEQVAKVFDRLIENNTIEIPDLAAVAIEKNLYSAAEDESEEDNREPVDPVYDSDHVKIKDRLLAYIMRRRQLLSNPELDMLDAWHERLAPFHGVNLLKYSSNIEQAIDAESPAQFIDGDWVELVHRLEKLSEDELQAIVDKIREKEGK